MGFRLVATTAVALAVVGALHGAAQAEPAALVVPSASKPVKVPGFRASLGYPVKEKITVAGSVETFSTKGTVAPKGDRIVSWTASFGDRSKAIGGTGLPKTFSHRYSRAGSYRVTFSVTDVHHHRATGSLTRVVIGAYLPPVVSAGARTVVLRGDLENGVPIAFSVSDVAWNHLASDATIDFGDGTSAQAYAHGAKGIVIHTYANPDLYPATVTVRDARGGTTRMQLGVRVSQRPFTGFEFPDGLSPVMGVPLLVKLDSFPGAGETAQPGVDFSAPGATVTAAPAGSGADYAVTWSTPGPHTLTATSVGAKTHLSFTDTQVVTVPPLPPLAVGLTGENGSTGLDGAGDPTGPVLFLSNPTLDGHTVTSWDLNPGDGSADLSGSGAFSQQYVYYPGAGTYQATLTLTLDDGTTLVGTYVTEIDDPPTVVISPTTESLFGGTLAAFTLSATFHGDAQPVRTSVTWDVADPSTTETFAGSPPTVIGHTYPVNGSYPVDVTVVDDHNGVSEQLLTVTP